MNKRTLLLVAVIVGVILFLYLGGTALFFGNEARTATVRTVDAPLGAAIDVPLPTTSTLAVPTDTAAPARPPLTQYVPDAPQFQPHSSPIPQVRPLLRATIDFEEDSVEIPGSEIRKIERLASSAGARTRGVDVIVHKPLSAAATQARAYSVRRALIESGVREAPIEIREGEFDGSTSIDIRVAGDGPPDDDAH